MITVSDNAASDLIYQRVGPAAASAVLDDLGLNDTHIRSDMTSAGRRVAAELGLPDAHNLDAQLATEDVDRVRALADLAQQGGGADAP